MNTQYFRVYTLYFLLCVFAALASYRLYFEGIEAFIAEGLDAIINGTGRAPDQYRILPYLVLSTIRDILSPVFGAQWKAAILLFESTSLFAATVLLHKLSATVRANPLIIIVLLLSYPFLMIDGARSAAAFILLFSCAMLHFSRPDLSLAQKAGFYIVLLAFSFTRADVALLLGLVCSIYMMQPLWAKILTALIPLAIQTLLVTWVYPNAEYYRDLIMVADNISLVYLINNPTSYLLMGLALYYRAPIQEFLLRLYREQKIILILIAGYILTVFIIGRPNEYRLFLPIFPVILLVIDKQKLSPAYPQDQKDS